jgi:sec-independent protein translocase protein TatA
LPELDADMLCSVEQRLINNTNRMLGLGARESVVLAAISVLLFGAKKIPELARGIGEAIRHVKGSSTENAEEGNNNNRAS